LILSKKENIIGVFIGAELQLRDIISLTLLISSYEGIWTSYKSFSKMSLT